jgi:hypothetical protein
MAYSPAAQQLRRCTATRRDGSPCRGWATWAAPDGRGLCAAHRHVGPGGALGASASAGGGGDRGGLWPIRARPPLRVGLRGGHYEVDEEGEP